MNDEEKEAARILDMSHETLQKHLAYDLHSGVFTRKLSTSNSVKVGQVAGSISEGRYIRVSVLGRQHWAHRLAWFYVHARWPAHGIDHINGIGTDNRIANLREARQIENSQNVKKSKSNTSGFIGVTRRGGRWIAQISSNYENKYLGIFPTKEQAAVAYMEAKKAFHQFNPTVRGISDETQP